MYGYQYFNTQVKVKMVKKSIIPCVSIFLIMIIMLIACSKRCVGSSEYKYSYEGYSE